MTADQAKFYDEFIPHFEKQVNNERNIGFRQWTRKWVHQPGKKVLDFGCAYGYNSEYLHREVSASIIGIDISPKCIELAKQRFSHGLWHCGDVTESFDPGERNFDFILMSDVIEHIPLDRHAKLFTTLATWSNQHATIIASVPNSEHHEVIKTNTYQPVEEKIEIASLLIEMAKAGFTRIISLTLANPYYRMIVQRIS